LHSAAKHTKNNGSDTTYICVYNTPARPSLSTRGAGEGCILVNPKLYLLLQIKNSFPQMQGRKVRPNQIQRISAK
jgi:hypothetical protein